MGPIRITRQELVRYDMIGTGKGNGCAVHRSAGTAHGRSRGGRQERDG